MTPCCPGWKQMPAVGPWVPLLRQSSGRIDQSATCIGPAFPCAWAGLPKAKRMEKDDIQWYMNVCSVNGATEFLDLCVYVRQFFQDLVIEVWQPGKTVMRFWPQCWFKLKLSHHTCSLCFLFLGPYSRCRWDHSNWFVFVKSSLLISLPAFGTKSLGHGNVKTCSD